jgi:(p)ppGpp synthase/HD superfamily hydrolase
MWRNDLESTNIFPFPGNIKNLNLYTQADLALISEALLLFHTKYNKNPLPTIKVAQLLVYQEVEAIVVISFLLAPLLWEKAISLAEIKKYFGKDISDILAPFFLPPFGRQELYEHLQEDSQMLLSPLSTPSHYTLLSLAFWLVDLEDTVEGEKVLNSRKAEAVLNFFVPIARKFNLRNLRIRLEDAAFRLLKPRIYEDIKSQVEPILAEDNHCLEILQKATGLLLKKNDINGEIQGRIKSLYSIYCKICRTGKDIKTILDRIGLRIIVRTVPDCYKFLGILHSHFQPIPGCLDDYIGLPKVNGYQSIHTCVYPVRNIAYKPIEFQIRTESMHKEAVCGNAAHWRYKLKTLSSTGFDWQESPYRNNTQEKQHNRYLPITFFRILHQQLFHDNIVIFGGAGRITRLPENATVSQYFQKLNTSLSPNSTIKVNGTEVDMHHVLRDGDSIEISPTPAATTAHNERTNVFRNSRDVILSMQFQAIPLLTDENKKSLPRI